MNILRRLIQEVPGGIDDVADLTVDELREDALGSMLLSVAPSFFAERVDEQAFFAQMSSAYLPVVDRLSWHQALEESERQEMPPPGPAGEPEWTTLVEGGGDRGALLPEDGSPDDHLAVFTRVGGSRRVLSFFWRGPDLHASVNLSGHCYPPDGLAGCDPGICGGCRRRKILEPVPGIACLCDHR